MKDQAFLILVSAAVLCGCQSTPEPRPQPSPPAATTPPAEVAAAPLPEVHVPGAPATGWEAPVSPTEKAAWAIYSRAQMSLRINDYDTAARVGRQALATLSTTDSSLAHGSLYNNVAKMLMRPDTLDESLKLSQQALAYNQQGSDYMGVTSSYMNMGDAYAFQNDVPNRDKYWLLAKKTAVDHHLDEAMPYVDDRLKVMNETP
jgi:tetratricopeptide (TPR) repeat protein